MNLLIAQQVALDDALVAPEDSVEIGKCNMRIDPTKTQKKATYQDSSSYQFKLDNKKFRIGVEVFREILQICPKTPNQEFVEPPSHEDIVTFIKPLGYKGALESILDFLLIICTNHGEPLLLSSTNAFLGKLRVLTTDKPVLEDMKACPILYSQRLSFNTSSPKNKYISMRNRLFMHSITNDSALGRLKFVAKNEDNKVYGMSIPDMMINMEIKNSKAYQTYLAFTTGIAIPKKVRKGTKAAITPKKKGSFLANDNIISELDVALELGKSISKTEAEEHEEARKVHETHERLVTTNPTRDEKPDESDVEPSKRPTGRRRQTGVTFRYTFNVSKKKIPAQSQKLKGMKCFLMLQCLKLRQGKQIKTSRRDYSFQQETSSSSEGAGITPYVLNEPKDKSTDTNEGAGITLEVLDVSKASFEVQDIDKEGLGSDEDDVILTSDEERTKSKKETTDSGKYDKDSDDEEEHIQEEHANDETPEYKYVHDAEHMHGDVEKQDDVNVEMKDAETVNEGKVDEEMAYAA
nr:hypothetical protein [Tanacetum cinerariifolium]